MFTKVVVFMVALYAQRVYSSGYDSPMVHQFTSTHQSDKAQGYDDLRYHGPTAVPHVLDDGHIADTKEVAAAKAKHLAAVAKAKTHSNSQAKGLHGYSDHGDIRYHEPSTASHDLHDGQIVDTKEVAAAKDGHLTAVAKENTHSTSHSQGSHAHVSGHGDFRYHGPTAIPHVLDDGHIADTKEVAAAKAKHLAAVAKAKTHSNSHAEALHGYSDHEDIRYHEPTTASHDLHDGHIADTKEVAAAKAEHLDAVAKSNTHSNSHAEGYHGYSGHGDIRYHGPTAVLHVLHDGHIADTEEVAAAKAEHYAAVAKAHTKAGYHQAANQHDYHESHDHGYAAHASNHGPSAQPLVLHTGYSADTHEVAAAKLHHHHHQAPSEDSRDYYHY